MKKKENKILATLNIILWAVIIFGMMFYRLYIAFINLDNPFWLLLILSFPAIFFWLSIAFLIDYMFGFTNLDDEKGTLR